MLSRQRLALLVEHGHVVLVLSSFAGLRRELREEFFFEDVTHFGHSLISFQALGMCLHGSCVVCVILVLVDTAAFEVIPLASQGFDGRVSYVRGCITSRSFMHKLLPGLDKPSLVQTQIHLAGLL